MPLWLQHTLVLTLVTACFAYVVLGACRTLAGRRSKLGNCCSKGCGSKAQNEPTATTGNRRIVFLPVEILRKRR
ncbi:MAG TPA: hypothetical protein VEA69_05080 [Tepidisphaeraceae bacterium]|nr:hypothetical protein [Tepidisphaeraceae bacterium]